MLCAMRPHTPAERRTQAMALPPLTDADAVAINAFLDAIWAESGLSRQTLDSYRRDLEGIARWREGQGGGLPSADRAALFDYLAWRSRSGYSPRSNARLLSALRAFFAHRVRSGARADDPTALLDPPRQPRSLPKALGESQIDALLAARAKINHLLEGQGVKVSVNDIIIKAAAVALKRVPEANASYTPEGIALHKHADIAVAVAIDGGLITPIVRAAETKGLAQISAEVKDLAARAKSKKLKPEEFQGGTFSVSNLGMFGIKSFASIINEPQGAIMSVGAGEQRPVVKDGQLAVATVMTVTLTCDHRVVDGAIGAKFLAAFKPLIEEPLTLIV